MIGSHRVLVASLCMSIRPSALVPLVSFGGLPLPAATVGRLSSVQYADHLLCPFLPAVLPAGIEFDAPVPDSPSLSTAGADHPEVIGENEELVLNPAPDTGRPSLDRHYTDRAGLANGGGGLQTPSISGMPPTKGLSIIDDLQVRFSPTSASGSRPRELTRSQP